MAGKPKIEVWALGKIKPYAQNAIVHDAENVASIAKSIREFGFTIPLLVAADGELIAGHGRLLAAQQIGLAEVPVIVATGMTPTQVRAYRIADNQRGEWDRDVLGAELRALAEVGFTALDALGVDDDLQAELAKLAAPPAPPAAPVPAPAAPPASGGEPTPAPTPEGRGRAPAGEYVDLVIPMKVVDRALTFDVMRAAKVKLGAETNGDALIAILREWRERNA